MSKRLYVSYGLRPNLFEFSNQSSSYVVQNGIAIREGALSSGDYSNRKMVNSAVLRFTTTLLWAIPFGIPRCDSSLLL